MEVIFASAIFTGICFFVVYSLSHALLGVFTREAQKRRKPRCYFMWLINKPPLDDWYTLNPNNNSVRFIFLPMRHLCV